MSTQVKLFSPKQVGQALGVSESSIKRWCDQGKINATRLVGGHRRVTSSDVLEFVRKSGKQLIEPKHVGLEPIDFHAPQIEDAVAPTVDALLKGDEQKFLEILTGLYFATHPLSDIFDLVVAPAFHEIGARWECDDVEVYQERRSCEICIRSFAELRTLLPKPAGNSVAIGGTLSDDIYQLPVSCTELLLRDLGFAATLLGTSIPGASFRAAISDLNPDLVWISVSYVANAVRFLEEFDSISKRCVEDNIALVVGGRALTSELRKQMTYSAFCDTMQHLVSFTKSMSNSQRSKS